MNESGVPRFLDRGRSFAASRAALAALDLDLFPALAAGPRPAAELRAELGLAEGAITDSFFDLLLACGLLVRSGERLGLGPDAEAVLASYKGVKSWGREMATTYRSLVDFEHLLRTGAFEETEMAALWPYKTSGDREALDGDLVARYSGVMDASQLQLSDHIAGAYDFSRHRHVMDFGGGYGRLGLTLAERYPGLRVTIVDLEPVCEETRRRIASAGLADRVEALGCDFLRDPLPEGAADLLLFCRVLHDWPDEQVMRLLARSRSCLESGGTALAVEPMLDEDEAPTESAVATALMLALLGGRRRSVQTYARMFCQVGYTDVAWRATGKSIWRVVTARG